MYDRRCGRSGAVIGPARVHGAVLVHWEGRKGAKMARLVHVGSLKLSL